MNTNTNTRDQYRHEMEQRYLKFIQKEDEREQAVIQKERRSKHRTRTHTPSNQTHSNNHITRPTSQVQAQQAQQIQQIQRQLTTVPSATTLDAYLPSKFSVSTIVLDSSLRDTQTYPQANQFVVKLVEPLRNVAALRLLRTEFYQPSNTKGYFVMNEVRIPLQLYNIESAYLYLNGYQSMQIAQDLNTTFFARMGPGTDIYPAVTGDIRQDPFIYRFIPIEPKLRRFAVQLMNADGSIYQVENARIVLTLAVYCLTGQ